MPSSQRMLWDIVCGISRDVKIAAIKLYERDLSLDHIFRLGLNISKLGKYIPGFCWFPCV